MKALLIAASAVALLGIADTNSAAASDRFGFSLQIGNRGAIYFGSGDRYGRDGYRSRFPRTAVVPRRSGPVIVQPVPVVVEPARDPSFGARRHVDELAMQLVRQTNAILWEMHLHHRHQPEFRSVYRAMYSLAQDARHVHELAHDGVHRPHPGDVDHIARDLLNMDQLFHQIEDRVDSWSSHSRWHHYHGDRVQSQMRDIGETLHHLMDDYGTPCGAAADVPPPLPDGPSLPPAPH